MLVNTRMLTLNPSSDRWLGNTPHPLLWHHSPQVPVEWLCWQLCPGKDSALHVTGISSALLRWHQLQTSLLGVDGNPPNPGACQELKRFTCFFRSDGSISLWMCPGGCFKTMPFSEVSPNISKLFGKSPAVDETKPFSDLQQEEHLLSKPL